MSYFDSLFQKCIWERNTFAIGLNYFALHFNDGSTGILNILNYYFLSKQVTLVKGIKRDKSWVRDRGGSRTAATFKMEHFVIIVNGWKRSILDVAAVLDPPLRGSVWIIWKGKKKRENVLDLLKKDIQIKKKIKKM